MPKLINLQGKLFGEWTVLNRKRVISKGYHTNWWCRCSCGKVVLVKAESLTSGRSRSCGCKKNYLRFKTLGIDQEFSTIKRYYYNYKRGALKRNIKFSISLDKFIKLTKQRCFYCGVEPSYTRKRKYLGGKDVIFNGIDRVNNNKGYVKGNCVTACFKCNQAKHSMSKDEFLEWIKKVYEFNYKK